MTTSALSRHRSEPRSRRPAREHVRLPEHRLTSRMVSRSTGSRPSIRRSPGSSIAASSTSRAPSARARRPPQDPAAGDPRARPHPPGPRGAARGRRFDRRAARPARRCARHREPRAPRPPGHRAHPAPDGVSVDHRHVGDPIDDALARLADPLVKELTAGHPERIRICDNDTLSLGLLRHLAHGPSALVRHGDLWQPRQGGPPPGSGQERPRPAPSRRVPHGQRPSPSARRSSRRAPGSAGPRSRGGSSTPRRMATGSRR